MPISTWQSPDLERLGPVVEVQFGVPRAVQDAILATGGVPPAVISVDGMIDTGASMSVMREGIPAALGLNPVGQKPVNTPSSQGVMALEYAARLLVGNSTGEFTFLEMPLKGQGIDCLIGRDVLSGALLVYVGPTESFTLSF